MTLATGQLAPDFTLKTQDEKDWKLSDFRDKKNVVLLWYPLDWSPTCETENCKITTQPVLAGKDVVVVGISRDSTWSHKAWKATYKIGHDLLADPMLSVTKEYGLIHPKVPFISHRATVVIDKQGKVAYCGVQENTGAERDWAPIQACLAKLA
jgi:peroxiredoxin